MITYGEGKYKVFLEEKKIDQETHEGEPRSGFYIMPERALYNSDENEDLAEESEENDAQQPEKPENQS